DFHQVERRARWLRNISPCTLESIRRIERITFDHPAAQIVGPDHDLHATVSVHVAQPQIEHSSPGAVVNYRRRNTAAFQCRQIENQNSSTIIACLRVERTHHQLRLTVAIEVPIPGPRNGPSKSSLC